MAKLLGKRDFRKFNGKVFRLVSNNISKKYIAKREAIRFQKKGYWIRIIKNKRFGGRYSLYARKK